MTERIFGGKEKLISCADVVSELFIKSFSKLRYLVVIITHH